MFSEIHHQNFPGWPLRVILQLQGSYTHATRPASIAESRNPEILSITINTGVRFFLWPLSKNRNSSWRVLARVWRCSQLGAGDPHPLLGDDPRSSGSVGFHDPQKRERTESASRSIFLVDGLFSVFWFSCFYFPGWPCVPLLPPKSSTCSNRCPAKAWLNPDWDRISFFMFWTNLPWNFVVFLVYGCIWSTAHGSIVLLEPCSIVLHGSTAHGFLWWIKEYRKKDKVSCILFLPGVEYCFCFPVLDLLFIPIAFNAPTCLLFSACYRAYLI